MTAYAQSRHVLIASPSDVSQRKEIFNAIAVWNGLAGNAGRKVLFVPLMWEQNTIADADAAPQPAINSQLLDRADYVLAVFYSRLGTPTDEYPAGTVEELKRRHGKAAIYFHPSPAVNMGDPGAAAQLGKLQSFRESVNGYAQTYTDTPSLLNLIRNQLDGWASDVEKDCGPPVITLAAPWKLDHFTPHLDLDADRPVSLLFYNIELSTFRSPHVFRETWQPILDREHVRVVLLLPQHKVDRLVAILPALNLGKDSSFLKRLAVCPATYTAGPVSESVSSSMAFVIGRYDDGRSDNEPVPVAQFTVLSEPFSTVALDADFSRAQQWNYKYYFQATDRELIDSLGRVWDQHYDHCRTIIANNLGINKPAAAATVEHRLDRQKKEVKSDNNKDVIGLIKRLRERLFDPNVPSYLLDNSFALLDWNPAFELIFPTDQFYRNMSVKEFVDRLDNNADVKKRGAKLIETPTEFDLEPLAYTSPIYGKMRFTKIASTVVDPANNAKIGWIVALNVNFVENEAKYEADLKRANEVQSLIGFYAQCLDSVLDRFPGYRELVTAHVAAAREKAHGAILDLASGPGILAAAMLQELGCSVTSVQVHDAMIELVRQHCSEFDGFSAVKADLDKVHQPRTKFYPVQKIGMRNAYDGACMLDSYQWLNDPVLLLKRLRTELLRKGARITVSLCGKAEIEEELGAINDNGILSASVFERFSMAMEQFIEHRLSDRYGADAVEGHLREAGYENITRTTVPYTIAGVRYKGFPFFVAETPSA